ncbi:hypothetical protein QJS04_geneDACA002147 [Acorus gramineus]|uniref:SWIRM domain-containing protein n=1 Tax=Acorus gramineus TaxID=55184 RepID=A0AAV9A8X0_ACOGR|nr:hypothetical protein QJS04_geneDACA002147 [Acorus gramineus]
MSDQPIPPFPLFQPNPNSNPNLQLHIPSTPAKRKRTGLRRRASAVPSPSPFPLLWLPNRLPIPPSSTASEIIFINKEPTAEALTALSAGFPADSLTDEETEAGVVSVIGGIEQVNYILIRNHILTRWRENVFQYLTKETLTPSIPSQYKTLLDSAYHYLLSHGYINFGVAPSIKDRILTEPDKPMVVIVGAGLAGIAAARQLMTFGFKVVVLEGRKRAGGRVYTRKMEVANQVVVVGTLSHFIELKLNSSQIY